MELSARAVRSRLISFVALLKRQKENLIPTQGKGLFHVLFGDVRKPFRAVDERINASRRLLDAWHNALNRTA